MTFANTSEINLKTEFETVTKTETQVNEDDFWFCYDVSRKETYSFMDDVTTVTITYHCTWYNL